MEREVFVFFVIKLHLLPCGLDYVAMLTHVQTNSQEAERVYMMQGGNTSAVLFRISAHTRTPINSFSPW